MENDLVRWFFYQQMVVFHSYVRLPEVIHENGSCHITHFKKCIPILLGDVLTCGNIGISRLQSATHIQLKMIYGIVCCNWLLTITTTQYITQHMHNKHVHCMYTFLYVRFYGFIWKYSTTIRLSASNIEANPDCIYTVENLCFLMIVENHKGVVLHHIIWYMLRNMGTSWSWPTIRSGTTMFRTLRIWNKFMIRFICYTNSYTFIHLLLPKSCAIRVSFVLTKIHRYLVSENWGYRKKENKKCSLNEGNDAESVDLARFFFPWSP